ncbi:MAG: fused MFS/spermidine synthase [Deltaproteobacteria bacterium]|nr:fused MFS/spermidine synthase [Deltaproteobacteria bacterium]
MKALLPLYSLNIFIGSALLFLIEPLIARYILPWFGSVPSVWNSCLFFFQLCLLAGYAYAHFLNRYFSPKKQISIHLCLLTVSLLFMPVIPGLEWKPTDPSAPEKQIVFLLAATIGLPFFLLSATSPLLQAWASRIYQERSPYRLYALSNLGSLLGLFSYPFIFEPQLTLRLQAISWSVVYCAFIILSLFCALGFSKSVKESLLILPKKQEEALPVTSCPRRHYFLWLWLSACSSVVLLATTNQIFQEISVVSLFWLLPLALYLISFIICFEYEKFAAGRLWLLFFWLTMGALMWMMGHDDSDSLNIALQIGIFSAVVFACSVLCHAQLVRLKPPAGQLTTFYLMISLGGTLGGAFVIFIAPIIFVGFWEFHLGVLLTYFCCALLIVGGKNYFQRLWLRCGIGILWLLGLAGLIYGLKAHINARYDDAIVSARNFYGVLTVTENNQGTKYVSRTLRHGPTQHGYQYLSPYWRSIPAAYYTSPTGINIAHRKLSAIFERGLNIGTVGLGAGTIAALGFAEDKITFYEINPYILEIATNYFTYLEDSLSQLRVVMGDARLSLENELKNNPGGDGYDLLILDAFNGDAIPVHLLTQEASRIYWQHLRPDGILAVHISNAHVDLTSVVAALAADAGKKMILISTEEDLDKDTYGTDWLLITNNELFLNDIEVLTSVQRGISLPKLNLWTDEYSNILQILKPMVWPKLVAN